MATEIEAVYHNGVLELKSALPLEEGQSVRLVMLTEGAASVEERVAVMHTMADQWLTRQASIGVPAAPEYSEEEWARLDTEWDKTLAEIQRHSTRYTESETAADVNEALLAVREQRPHRVK